MLAFCPNLQCLDLSRNHMTDQQLKVISKALSQLTQLKSLQLACNCLTEKRGCKYLYHIWRITRKRSEKDIRQRLDAIMQVDKCIPKELALEIFSYTTTSADFGIHEMILIRNHIRNMDHPRICKLRLALRHHLI